MQCEIFLCPEIATHKARVRIPGLPITLPARLCTAHVNGKEYVEGNIIEAERL